jgi:NADH-quinone oxidoreductase subunit L
MERDLLELLGVVPLLPLAGAAFLMLFGRRIGEPVAGWIATGLMVVAFLWSLVMLIAMVSLPEDARSVTSVAFTWLPVDQLQVEFGFLADPLSITWCLLVTGVGSLIFLYSIGYMRGDPNFGRFFTYLSLFAGSMLLLVTGSSYLLTFLGWEGVGLCSYLLIAFWFERSSAAVAGKKAFVTNRVGDVGFLLAMFILIAEFGTLDYGATGAAAPGAANDTVTAVALLLLLAAVGKSAQIPLFPWLTDAMEGPTPVSALIHAATMVTAGVYLIARAHPFFEASGDALTVVAWVGVLTALLAGGAALVQPDIKRVLAYSTISQLGYMFLALGVQAYTAAVFMVLMHAFFKGCLFLGAGSVIHGNEENQDIRIMGRYRRFLPYTAIGMTIAWLAIAGVPPLAGFWAKDEILQSAFLAGDYPVWALGLIAAVFTAMYMTRLIQLVFYGNERFRDAATATPAVSGGSDDDGRPGRPSSNETPLAASTNGDDDAPPVEAAGSVEPEPPGEEIDPADTPEALGYDPDFLPTVSFTEATPRAPRLHGHDPHESPVVMLVPILVLATLSIFGGLINLPLDGLDFLDQFLEPVFAGVHQPHPDSFVEGFTLEGIAVVFALVGLGIGLLLYRRGLRNAAEDPIVEHTGRLAPVLGHAYYVDDGQAAFFDGPGRATAEFLDEDIDQKVIDGGVNGVARLVRGAGEGLRHVQDGLVRRYALGILVGAVAVLLFLLVYVAR